MDPGILGQCVSDTRPGHREGVSAIGRALRRQNHRRRGDTFCVLKHAGFHLLEKKPENIREFASCQSKGGELWEMLGKILSGKYVHC